MRHVLNFKEQFAAAVKSGRKRQTIRKRRKNPIRVGDTLAFWTGLRTKGARPLRSPARCKSLTRIAMCEAGAVLGRRRWLSLKSKTLRDLARMDGFATPDEMIEFFKDLYGLPVFLNIIRW
jgi:hypothetical protein